MVSLFNRFRSCAELMKNILGTGYGFNIYVFNAMMRQKIFFQAKRNAKVS